MSLRKYGQETKTHRVWSNILHILHPGGCCTAIDSVNLIVIVGFRWRCHRGGGRGRSSTVVGWFRLVDVAEIKVIIVRGPVVQDDLRTLNE
jgi:hypothetical protein